MAVRFALPGPMLAELLAWATEVAGDPSASLLARPSLFLHAVEYCLQRAAVVPRDLDFAEVFAGTHRSTNFVVHLGMRAAAFDRDLHPNQDVSLLLGVVLCGMLVLRVQPRGVVWFSPRCAAWLPWVSRSNHCRSFRDPLGDTSRHDVAEANLTAIVGAWLAVVPHARNVFVCIEQPLRSFFFAHPAIRAMLGIVGAERMVTYLGGFGAASLKPIELHVTVPVHAALRLRRPFDVARARLGDGAQRLVEPQRGGWLRAAPGMSASQTYPLEFAMAIAETVALARL